MVELLGWSGRRTRPSRSWSPRRTTTCSA